MSYGHVLAILAQVEPIAHPKVASEISAASHLLKSAMATTVDTSEIGEVLKAGQELINELDNHISIWAEWDHTDPELTKVKTTVTGPQSTSEDTLTLVEAQALYEVLGKLLSSKRS